MIILVTGCAGFIGSHLVESLLNKGHNVIGIDSFTNYYSKELKLNNLKNYINNANFTFIENNINNINDFPSVDIVYHLAAQAGVRASWGSYFSEYTKNNIDATQKLLENYKNKNIKKFIYSSSSSVYGDSLLPMNENNITRPVSPYGVTKLAAENLCYLYYKNFNLPTISLRYFTVYGPRQRPDMAINKFIRSIYNGKPITIFGDGCQTRDFTFVTDIVNANQLAADYSGNGDVFNIGGGNRIKLLDLIKLLEKNIGIEAKLEFIEKQKGDVEDTWADIQKAKTLLKWSPEINITVGISRYIQWYKENIDVLSGS